MSLQPLGASLAGPSPSASVGPSAGAPTARSSPIAELIASRRVLITVGAGGVGRSLGIAVVGLRR